MKVKSLQLALLALTSQVFAATSLEHKPRNHPLSKRSVADILLDGGTTCGGNSSTEEILRFNLIASQGAVFTADMYSDGPMAVGSLSAPFVFANYLDSTSYCSNEELSFGGYALVVRYESGTTFDGASVRGEVFLPVGEDISKVSQQIPGCPVNNNMSTGLFDFDTVMAQATEVSTIFSAYQPSLYLDESGNLVTIGNKTNGYDVITMNTCNGGNCPLYPERMSDPSSFLFNETTWNGPVSGQWPLKLIVNVPVDSGSTFFVSTTHPSIGMHICSTIWNFYPSDSEGYYNFSTVNIVFRNEGPMGGFFLAPEGLLSSGDTSGLAGTILARTYNTGNNRIYNYEALDDTCEFFNDCNAADNCTPGGTATVIITDTTTTTSTTTSDIIRTQTITENETTTTAVIIIPEQDGHKHSKHDGSYHNKDDDSEEEEEDCEEEHTDKEDEDEDEDD